MNISPGGRDYSGNEGDDYDDDDYDDEPPPVRVRKKSRPHPVPKVGDTVVLNLNGLEQIFGSSVGLTPMLEVRMRVLAVESTSLTEPEKTYPIVVDNVDINQFLIDHNCFDIVQPLKSKHIGGKAFDVDDSHFQKAMQEYLGPLDEFEEKKALTAPVKKSISRPAAAVTKYDSWGDF